MPTLSDHIRPGTAEEISAHLIARSSALVVAAKAIRERRELGDISAVLSNILHCAARQLQILDASVNLPIEVAAGACRTAFELFLRVRSLEMNPNETIGLLTERIHDELSLVSAFMRLAHPETPKADLAPFEERQRYLESFVKKHKLPDPIRRKVKKRAEQVGMLDDYESLYCFYSNYTHATSWLINASDQERDGAGYRGIFLANTQVYVEATYSCVQRVVSAPRSDG